MGKGRASIPEVRVQLSLRGSGTPRSERELARRWVLHRAALLSLSLASSAWGQSADPRAVQPERPTVATHAGNVAPGSLEIEAGVEADRFDDGSHALGVPTVLKFGVASHVQLNVALPLTRRAGSSIGAGDFSLGLKWHLLDGAPLVGDFAVLPSVKFATGASNPGRGTGTTDLSLLLISSHSVGPAAVDLNLGYTRRSGDGSAAPRDATLWTAAAGFPLRGALGMAVELYGYPRTTGPAGQPSTVALLGGPTLLVRPWLALDAGVIVGLSGPQPDAIYAGLVWNAGRLWRAERAGLLLP